MHLRRQQGAATLIVVTMLGFLVMLAAAFASRTLVAEQKTSANQARHTQAFEAAEAGAQWALAMLNGGRIDERCEPSERPDATSFRDRYLPTARVRPGCVLGPDGWQCSCPVAGAPALSRPDAAGHWPAFTIEFTPGPRPGVVQLRSFGCSDVGDACVPGATERSDAQAQVRELLAATPALRTLPSAPMVAAGRVDIGELGGAVANEDASTHGVAIIAGGRVQSAARLSGVAGSPAAAVVERDPVLAGADADRLFFSFFGLDRATFARWPTVAAMRCGNDCGPPLATALARGARALHVTGDLRLGGEATLGTPERPVLLIVDGHAEFTGAARLHGLLFVAAPTWAPGHGGALVQGAAIVAGDVVANGPVDFVYDRSVLERLQADTAAFVRVPGSWSDLP